MKEKKKVKPPTKADLVQEVKDLRKIRETLLRSIEGFVENEKRKHLENGKLKDSNRAGANNDIIARLKKQNENLSSELSISNGNVHALLTTEEDLMDELRKCSIENKKNLATISSFKSTIHELTGSELLEGSAMRLKNWQ